MTYLEQRFELDENSTFGKFSNLSSIGNSLPKYGKFVEMAEIFKLKDTQYLNTDDLYDEVALNQEGLA